MSPKHPKPYAQWNSDDSQPENHEICPTTGKRQYATATEAKATAQHQMSQKQSSSLQLRTYLCLYCNNWHLTSKGA